MIKQDSRIAVFGAGGLAGGAIVRQLRSQGYTKILCPRSREVDLREQTQVRDWFRVNKVDYVFLAAALVGGIMANKTS